MAIEGDIKAIKISKLTEFAELLMVSGVKSLTTLAILKIDKDKS